MMMVEEDITEIVQKKVQTWYKNFSFTDRVADSWNMLSTLFVTNYCTSNTLKKQAQTSIGQGPQTANL